MAVPGRRPGVGRVGGTQLAARSAHDGHALIFWATTLGRGREHFSWSAAHWCSVSTKPISAAPRLEFRGTNLKRTLVALVSAATLATVASIPVHAQSVADGLGSLAPATLFGGETREYQAAGSLGSLLGGPAAPVTVTPTVTAAPVTVTPTVTAVPVTVTPTSTGQPVTVTPTVTAAPTTTTATKTVTTTVTATEEAAPVTTTPTNVADPVTTTPTTTAVEVTTTPTVTAAPETVTPTVTAPPVTTTSTEIVDVTTTRTVTPRPEPEPGDSDSHDLFVMSDVDGSGVDGDPSTIGDGEFSEGETATYSLVFIGDSAGNGLRHYRVAVEMDPTQEVLSFYSTGDCAATHRPAVGNLWTVDLSCPPAGFQRLDFSAKSSAVAGEPVLVRAEVAGADRLGYPLSVRASPVTVHGIQEEGGHTFGQAPYEWFIQYFVE